MKLLHVLTNNRWQTLSKEKEQPPKKKVFWFILKLLLLLVRIVCKVIDLIGGGAKDG